MPYYRKITVYSGPKEQLTTETITRLEAPLPQGEQVELVLHFAVNFPGFTTAANTLEAALKAKGVPPWPGNARIVYPDESAKTWSIRWVKHTPPVRVSGLPQTGVVPWGAIIIASLVVVALALIFLTVWQFNRFVPVAQLCDQYPQVCALLTLGFGVGGLYLLYKWAQSLGVPRAVRERIEREVRGAIAPRT